MPSPKPLGLFGGNGGSGHTEARRELLKSWAADCWTFLTGQDIDGQPMIVTQDELAQQPFRAFPTDKPYLKALLDELLGDHKVVLVDKSRQMMVSTLCALAIYWTVMFQKGRLCFISKQTEDLAVMLMQDKIRGVHLRTPVWFQNALPLSMTPANTATAKQTGSRIVGVAQNAAARHFRGNTASIILIDEAAFQDFFGDMLQAAEPMSARIWGVTTAAYGNPGAEVFFRLKSEP